MTVHLQTGILSGAHLTLITLDDGITVFVSLSGSHNDFLCHVTIYFLSKYPTGNISLFISFYL